MSLLLLSLLLVVLPLCDSSATSTLSTSPIFSGNRLFMSKKAIDIGTFRSGAYPGQKQKAKEVRQSPLQWFSQVLSEVKPITRYHMLLSVTLSCLQLLGLPASQMFALNMNKLYEIWRPLTSIAYLGPPSMAMANNIYFLSKYGQYLEDLNGTITYSWFIIIQTVILTSFSLLLGFPYSSQSIISAIVYANSRIEPNEKL